MLENGRKNMLNEMQTANKVAQTFSKLKWLRKGNNFIIELFQQTKKLQCMYVALKNLNISSKEGPGPSKK